MWEIQINWNGKWISLASGFATQAVAEWATAEWKQNHNITGDPFRAHFVSDTQCDPDELDARDIAIDVAKIEVAYALDECRAASTAELRSVCVKHTERAIPSLERALKVLQGEGEAAPVMASEGGAGAGDDNVIDAGEVEEARVNRVGVDASEVVTPWTPPRLSFGDRDDFESRR